MFDFLFSKFNNIKKKISRFLYLLNIFKRILVSIKNYLKLYINKNIDDFYIPNLAIKNVININPNKIEYLNSVPLKFNKSTQFILNFDWQKTNEVIKNSKHPTLLTCKELFVEDKKLDETSNYFYFKEKIREQTIFKNCKNHDDIIKFLKKKIELFKAIKINGVKKNMLFNIQCMVDKNLNLVKINSGNHRLAISRILNLNSIPVEIKVINKECFKNSFSENNKILEINKFIKKIEQKYS